MLERSGHSSVRCRGGSRTRLTDVIAVAAIWVIAVVAPGCGSGKHSTSAATTPALSKAQFLAQGNAICARGNARLLATRKALEKTVGNHAPT